MTKFLLAAIFFIVLFFSGRVTFQKYALSRRSILCLEGAFYFSCVLTFGILHFDFSSLPVSTVFLCLLTFLSGGLVAFEKSFRAPAFVGLAVFLALICSVESFLTSLPKDVLPREISSPPSLYSDRLDRAASVYRTKGFRGRKPESESANGALRIFAMGGSSTWGVPLVSPRETYPAVLQTLASERRPGEKIEVYNAGLAGMGIMQVLDSISETILRFNPHIITVSLWYNDSSRQSIWYGIPGRSDRDVYLSERVLKKIARFPILNRFFQSRIYGGLRYLLLQGKTVFQGAKPAVPTERREIAENPRRMSPEEYRWALEQVAILGEKKNFLPVFVFEPLNRTSTREDSLKENEYYLAMKQVAEKYQVPLVDTLTPFHERMGDWLFYDLVHPNPSGHRLMAEILYDFLFSPEKIGPKGVKILREVGIFPEDSKEYPLRK